MGYNIRPKNANKILSISMSPLGTVLILYYITNRSECLCLKTDMKSMEDSRRILQIQTI